MVSCRNWQTQRSQSAALLVLPNQCLTKLPPSVTFSDVIDVRTALIPGNLLISGNYFQNPAYRLIRYFQLLARVRSAQRKPATVSRLHYRSAGLKRKTTRRAVDAHIPVHLDEFQLASSALLFSARLGGFGKKFRETGKLPRGRQITLSRYRDRRIRGSNLVSACEPN